MILIIELKNITSIYYHLMNSLYLTLSNNKEIETRSCYNRFENWIPCMNNIVL